MEFGGYGQGATFGGAIGYDSINGPTFTGFSGVSIGYSSTEAYSFSFTWQGGITNEGGSSYRGIGTPTAYLTPIAVNFQINQQTGNYFFSIGVTIPGFADMVELGAYIEWEPLPTLPALPNTPLHLSSNPLQTGPIPWGYEETYLDYLSGDSIRREFLATAIRSEEIRIVRRIVDNFFEEDPSLDFPGGPCFPAGTPVLLADGSIRPIEEIAADNAVAAFAIGTADECGPVTAPLSAGRVTRLFSNITPEWIELNWTDLVSGELRSLTATPGHFMLTPEGGWKQLIEMVAGEIPPMVRQSETERLTKGAEYGEAIGAVRLVTAEGEIVVARAWSIKYSAATAHLYEQAEMLVTRNAKQILVHVTTGRDAASPGKLPRAAGMKCVGGSYVA